MTRCKHSSQRNTLQSYFDWLRSLRRPSVLDKAIARQVNRSRRLIEEASTWHPLGEPTSFRILENSELHQTDARLSMN